MAALLDPKAIDRAGRRALEAVFDTIAEGGRIAVRPADYAEMFQAALADGGVVRPREQDVRVRIYGPLEARLQNVDLMVLGGLTEGVWPPETRADPWLSRGRCARTLASTCRSGGSACRRTISCRRWARARWC